MIGENLSYLNERTFINERDTENPEIRDIGLGMQDASYVYATAEMQRRKRLKSHRWDKTRGKRMGTSLETLSHANDRIRLLKERLV